MTVVQESYFMQNVDVLFYNNCFIYDLKNQVGIHVTLEAASSGAQIVSLKTYTGF